MDCPNRSTDNTTCNCTYPCPLHGNCCACLAKHRRAGQLPACYFTAEQEKTYDRSIQYYCSVNQVGPR